MNMNTSRTVCRMTLSMILLAAGVAQAQPKEIPQALEPWKSWVLWGAQQPDCQTPFNASDQRICSWPFRLKLAADQEKGSWQFRVRVYEETWVSLPGNDQNWPFEVRANDERIPVVQRNGVPSVRLPVGLHDLAGEFRWRGMPQRIAVPQQIGLLSLVVDGVDMPTPIWDAAGNVWLRRLRVPAAEKDLLALQVYRVVEDGMPLWLRTEIDLTVAGKSREEQIGWVLPEGWQLSLVESPIPVAVDDQGRMKAQVRAGKWKIQVHAFRNTDVDTFRFASGVQPVTGVELVGFRAKPDFRIAELEGVRSVDVSQTTFPDKWRDLPVFEWKTDSTFRLVQKMRGMGSQRPKGLTIDRHFWLDEDGRGMTYRDLVSGQLQQIWRLDVAASQQLGAVRSGGEHQLITTNPQTGANGVEIRDRNLTLEAIGRVDGTTELSATGWQADAESLKLSLSLPPGWRVFAVFGADRVDGDWLTAWSLLDLFLLLIFSLAVFRLWGFRAGIVALLAFGLSYHEPGAPRLTWIFLLIPIALLRVVTEGSGKRWLDAWKYFAVALLVLSFVPFSARQIQGAIYPQLETAGVSYGTRSMFQWLGVVYNTSARVATYVQETEVSEQSSSRLSSATEKQANLLFDPMTKIQTGPAVPEWGGWNLVFCSWKGPVSRDQQIVPLLISRPMHQCLTVVRLLLLFLLAAIILGVRKFQIPFLRRRAGASVVAGAVVMFAVLLPANDALAQIPDSEMLNTLRQRLLEPSDAFPQAAEISSADLALNEGRVSMQVEIHAAIDVAVPLPGRLPTWSPLSVTIDDQPEAMVCRRDDGYLWVMVPQGVHKIVVEGWLAEASEWEWTYLLKPRRVSIVAPSWNVTGVRSNGRPDDQVFFSRREQLSEGAATYDQKNFRPIVAVDRHLEIGLLWKVRNTVTRLSAPGKAISLRIPLLSGESVLTSSGDVQDGMIEVNLGTNQTSFTWESEIESGNEIQIEAAQTAPLVERWHLVTSSVWNVTFTRLMPIFELDEDRLIPVWRPWPGEGVTLSFRRPKAISGETITVQRVHHEAKIGARRRETQLNFEVESSLGNDFGIEFDPKADITSLTVDGHSIPVQRDDGQLIVPLRPGKQSVKVAWAASQALKAVAPVGAVKLPVDGANVTTVMVVPENRWVLWAGGPLRGPAVRFWTIVVTALLFAVALASLRLSPLRRIEWVLLALGLTQVHVAAAMLVVGWLFLLAWRGKREPNQMGFFRFNLLQLGLVFLTVIVLGIFIVVVGEGLLGNPEMFIVGNGSSRTNLNWYQPRTGAELPDAYIVSVSVWFYRVLMLVWALWLATALLRWLQTGWNAFSNGGCWKRWGERRSPPLAELVEP